MGVTLAAGPPGKSPERSAQVVEIAGPAGAGKTTLFEALSRASPNIRAVASLRTMSYLASFAATALASTPLHLRRYARHSLGWRERMIMIHAGALHHMVPRTSQARLTLFDQGPVFMLTRLYGSGVERIEDERVRRWWAAMITRWASTVDKVIRLDAPDAVLVQRIRVREKWHVTKEKSEQDTYEFLRSFRRACDATLSRLGCLTGPRLVEFDTSTLSVNEIAEQLLPELSGGRAAHRGSPSAHA